MAQSSKKVLGRGKNLDWHTALFHLEGAYADGTLRAYRSDIATFVTWAKAHRYIPFPADPETIAAFVTDQAETLASSTIKRRLAALNKLHRLLRLDNAVDDEEVKLALRRAYRKNLSRPRQAQGLTSDLRDKLLEACTTTYLENATRRLFQLDTTRLHAALN